MPADLRYSDAWLQMWVGDARDALRQMPEKSVHTVCTSPPFYGLRDYGTAVWEGGNDPTCDHKQMAGGRGTNVPQTKNPNVDYPVAPHRGGDPNYCVRCGATRVEPTVWGGDKDHDHVFDQQVTLRRGQGGEREYGSYDGGVGRGPAVKLPGSSFCECGAWRGALGLEPTPDLYVEHLVEVFDEVWRVLRDDGILWLNLGDSYANDTKWGGTTGGKHASGLHGDPAIGRVRRTTGLKSKDLIGIPWLTAFALRTAGWYLRGDIVWCLSGGTRVYARTQKGEMPMTIKDLVRLDPSTVSLWNGAKWTQALGWSEAPRAETVELEFRNGERVGCTPHHEWPTQRGAVQAGDIQVGDVVETCRLPAPEKPVAQALDDALTGWLTGLFIAEGSRSGNTIQFSGHINDPSRVTTMERVAAAYHATVAVHQTSENGVTLNVHGRVVDAILRTYVTGEGARGKHLSTAAWQRSDKFLLGVAEGYLEGDGHWDDQNGRWRLAFTANDAWASDLRTLGARLGSSVRLRRANHSCAGRPFPGWRGEWKAERHDHPNVRPDGEVVAIRRSRARKFWHIGVRDEPNHFALASGLLTSNSKPNVMPESVKDRPTRSHESIFMLTKQPQYYFDMEAVKEPVGSATLLAANRKVEEPGKVYQHDEHSRMGKTSPNRVWSDPEALARMLTGRHIRDVWHTATVSYPGAHFATWPPKLVEPMVKASTSEHGCCPVCGTPWRRLVMKGETVTAKGGTPHNADYGRRMHGLDELSGDGEVGSGFGITEVETLGWARACAHEVDAIPCTVLDIFGGSGTTAMVAQALGRKAILIDLNPEYSELQMVRNRDIPLGLDFE